MGMGMGMGMGMRMGMGMGMGMGIGMGMGMEMGMGMALFDNACAYVNIDIIRLNSAKTKPRETLTIRQCLRIGVQRNLHIFT